MLKGIGASPGIVLGKALVIEETELVIERKTINDTQAEVTKLKDAVAISKEELTKVKEKALAELGEHEAEIFEAHLLVLEDPELVESAVCKINDEKVNAEFALNEIKEMFVTMFESMDNEYMRERAADIKDVTNRIIRHMTDDAIKRIRESFGDGPADYRKEMILEVIAWCRYEGTWIIEVRDIREDDTQEFDAVFLRPLTARDLVAISAPRHPLSTAIYPIHIR